MLVARTSIYGWIAMGTDESELRAAILEAAHRSSEKEATLVAAALLRTDWIELARHYLSSKDWSTAGYHSYAGIGAAQTSIDIFGHWLNFWAAVGEINPFLVDVSKSKFLCAVTTHGRISPAMAGCVRRLSTLLTDEIKPYRQALQHRAGFRMALMEGFDFQGTEGQPQQRFFVPPASLDESNLLLFDDLIAKLDRWQRVIRGAMLSLWKEAYGIRPASSRSEQLLVD